MQTKNLKGCVWYDSLFNCYRWSRPYLKQDEYIGLRAFTYGGAQTKEEAWLALQIAEEKQKRWRETNGTP